MIPHEVTEKIDLNFTTDNHHHKNYLYAIFSLTYEHSTGYILLPCKIKHCEITSDTSYFTVTPVKCE